MIGTTETTDEQMPEHVLDLVTSRIQYTDHHAWIPWAWAALARGNDVPATVDERSEDYPSQLMTLLALRYLFEKFHDVYNGTEQELEPPDHVVDEVRPGITVIELARYAERNGHFAREDPETDYGLLRAAIPERAEEVRRRLLDLVGEGRLFASLFIAGRSRPEELVIDRGNLADEPIGGSLILEAFDPYIDGIVNFDLTADKAHTYEWLRGDMRPL